VHEIPHLAEGKVDLLSLILPFFRLALVLVRAEILVLDVATVKNLDSRDRGERGRTV